MIVKVRLFAVARELAGESSIDLELDDNPNVGDVRNALMARFPELNALSGQLRFAVNEAYANDETAINPDDEVACIPPVSGG